jgi:predicted transcriptional regulator
MEDSEIREHVIERIEDIKQKAENIMKENSGNYSYSITLRLVKRELEILKMEISK